MSEGKFIQTERLGHITVLTIARPEVRNALNPAANEQLSSAIDEFEADREQWVAIVTGAGERAFCAGVDLKAIAAGETRRQPAKGFGGMTGRYDLDKPVIAAVNGDAVGGGLELVLACDLVIAAEHARFGLPEPRVGTAALAGGLQRLPRQIGLRHAMEMILMAKLIDAHEGYRLGLVNVVVPATELRKTALQWAENILHLSPLAVRVSKRCALEGLNEPSLAAAIAAQRDKPSVRQLMQSEDRIEGARAFAQGRSPVWKGA